MRKDAIRKDSGLSMLEVLVAVAVIGAALTPLVAIQGQISQTHVRYQAAYANATLQRNALDLLQDMNPMKTPQGDIDLDGANHMRWTATPITRVDRSTDYPVGDGRYDMALYTVAVEIYDAKAAATTPAKVRFSTERIGWQRLDIDPTSIFGG